MKKLIIQPNKYGGKSSVVSCRIPDELLQELETLSIKTGRSRNEILLMMIEFGLENIEIADDDDSVK